MNLKDNPSPRVTVAQQVNKSGKGAREDRPNANRIYESPEFKNALNDVSTQFRDKTNQREGKGDRQNGPDSPMTSLIKRSVKDRNIFRKQ